MNVGDLYRVSMGLVYGYTSLYENDTVSFFVGDTFVIVDPTEKTHSPQDAWGLRRPGREVITVLTRRGIVLVDSMNVLERCTPIG